MINKDTLKEILKKGGDILQYLLLNYINLNIDIEDIKQNIKIAGVISLMIKKDLIQLLSDGKYLITEKGKQFLNLEEDRIVLNKDVDISLKDKLSQRLEKNIGKKQLKGFGDVYFIPTTSELQVHLSRFWKKYPDCKDVNKIEKILLNHIDSCCKRNSFAPAIKYFIYKETNGGYLGAAYENFEEEEKEIVQKEANNFDGVNI
jgi:hypothetical protein